MICSSISFYEKKYDKAVIWFKPQDRFCKSYIEEIFIVEHITTHIICLICSIMGIFHCISIHCHRKAYMCMSKLDGSVNGLSPIQWPAHNEYGILLIGCIDTSLKFKSKYSDFQQKKIHLHKWQPFCVSLSVLISCSSHSIQHFAPSQVSWYVPIQFVTE